MKRISKNAGPDNEANLYTQIRELIVAARHSVARGVNLVQVRTNFEIGRHIVEHEQAGAAKAAYGQAILKTLSEKLAAEFGRGFSADNLENMRKFYLAYRPRLPEISEKTSRKSPIPTAGDFNLGWSHYVFLCGISNGGERAFYEIEAAEQGWNLNELKRQFNSGLYERLALSRDKAGIRKLAQQGQIVSKPEDVLKEPLVLEFLGLSEQARYSESDLENAVITQIEKFLLELGKGFLFEARQKRFTFAEDHFFVDLVFYNRLLRCYVLVDLKIGKLTHQDLGQMQMYVNYFDRNIKTKTENATIGIVLCTKKHEALVEITLPKGANIHAKEYQLYLPSKEELQKKLFEWSGEKL